MFSIEGYLEVYTIHIAPIGKSKVLKLTTPIMSCKTCQILLLLMSQINQTKSIQKM